MKVIELTQGRVAIVDDEDFEELAQWRWQFQNQLRGYAVRSQWIPMEQRLRSFSMHRVIMKAPAGFDVDHVNMNGLDNRKENLRICTRSQNLFNRSAPNHKNSLRIKGVSWHKIKKKYEANIKIGGKQKYLGSFLNIEDAKAAYDAIAVKLHGEFARLN